MQGAPRVITLELRLDGQSPIGRARTPDNRERAFAGWLALVAAIDALATADPDTGADKPSGRHRRKPDDQTSP